jgi:carbonic anhydrase/acetyltransferase-like protein (isoleucine patch superfamily)
MIRSFRGITPKVALSAYVDASAQIIGSVEIGENSSIWPNTSIRGDNGLIHIGSETNIQENCALHLDEGVPLTIGDRVTVGHSVTLHGCILEDECLIGIGATVLNKARIGKGSVVAAGSLVPEGMQVPADTLVMGVPAKPRRAVTKEEQERFRYGVDHYVERARLFKEEWQA